MNRSGNICALNVGLADMSGTLRLRLNTTGNRGGNTFLTPEEMSVIREFGLARVEKSENSYIEEVPVAPLGELLSEQGVKVLKGAKFDIERFEYRALHHFFSEADPLSRPTFLSVEFEPLAVRGVGGDVLSLLAGHGYQSVVSGIGSDRKYYIMARYSVVVDDPDTCRGLREASRIQAIANQVMGSGC